jgi:hypothetical protein
MSIAINKWIGNDLNDNGNTANHFNLYNPLIHPKILTPLNFSRTVPSQCNLSNHITLIFLTVDEVSISIHVTGF